METMISTLYVVPHYSCNLDCPHCDIHKIKSNYEELIFIDRLRNINANKIVLFGGEPLLYQNTFTKIVETNKIDSVSTNLLLLNDYYTKYIEDYNLGVATSWNPKRFTNLQESIWIENLSKVNCDILITLTDDLISNEGTNQLLEMFNKIKDIKTINCVRFEQEVNESLAKEHFEKVDDWLCKISKNWSYEFSNEIAERVKDWKCNCSKVMTLEPNGTLRKGCPQYSKTLFLDECLKCSLNSICQPCVLQKECSFPKKFYCQVIGNE